MTVFNIYKGRVPACGCFCGGCPVYTRDKNPCPGAEINIKRCEKCTTFHLCCLERGITHCHECEKYPCQKLKSFAKRWLKYGQDFLDNQKMISELGEKDFLKFYNSKVSQND